MTQSEKNRTEQIRDEWTVNAAQEEMRERYQRRKADRRERKRQLEERNEALRNMLRR